MPRKQRFKPSRKPKPVQPPEAMESPEIQRSNAPLSTDIETGNPVRSSEDSVSVIEKPGTDTHRA